MTMLISHPKQTTTIQLTNVASVWFPETEMQKGKIHFCYAAMNNEECYTEVWTFETPEEAKAIHAKILDRFATEITLGE
ncbi:MAG: hypothetical protein JKY89_10850 [Immundisolibacteraceae bacterium]|nr:hypothetical protein [Immundisolibacteraceae bacterium]